MLALAALLAWTGGCDLGQVGEPFEDDTMLSEYGDPEPEEEGDYSTFTNYNLPLDATVKVCKVSRCLNNRSGPGSKYMVLRCLKSATQAKTVKRSGSWYKLDTNGKLGWSYGKYLCKVSGSSSDSISDDSSSNYGLNRSGIINISKRYVGFSYWWGSSSFPSPWASPQDQYKGKCYGSKSYSHSGSYGSDCSGFVGKVWQLPPSMPFYMNKHPYSTYNYYYGRNYWSSLSKKYIKKADALVYRSSSGGHILIYESGNAWGKSWTYESRNCTVGVVHNLRTVSSSYRARKRNGV
jgi:uncharacterized protein YraI